MLRKTLDRKNQVQLITRRDKPSSTAPSNSKGPSGRIRTPTSSVTRSWSWRGGEDMTKGGKRKEMEEDVSEIGVMCSRVAGMRKSG